MNDTAFMQIALNLAERGRGFVEPNPLVGAVIVDASGSIVGQGFHERFGQAHAEVNALKQAGEQAHGGTLYVTLEPCCHHGKTPPCTDAIMSAGLRRVVAAMSDPFPAVAGQGAALLRDAGLTVDIGCMNDQASQLNASYLKLLRTGLPWVHLKWAMTLDGRIATHTGDSKWITNEASRAKAHELRGRMDAILVGRGTVLADDPLLTARPAGPRVAARVIISRSGELPTDCQLRRTAKDVPVIVYTRHAARLHGWSQNGAEIVELDPTPQAILADLGRRRFTNVMIEGGSRLLSAFFDCHTADEAHIFIAPKLLGNGPSPLTGNGLASIANAKRLTVIEQQSLDGDFYWHGRFPDVDK